MSGESREEYMNAIEQMARRKGHEAGKDAEPLADLMVSMDEADGEKQKNLLDMFIRVHMGGTPPDDYEEWGLKKWDPH
jgi:hypothetical protein